MTKTPTAEHPIPLMTDPLGRYWKQPPRCDIAIDDTHALMSQETFYRLQNYSGSIPSGKYEGKMWRMFHQGKWLLRWYVADQDHPVLLRIPYREIIIVEEGGAV